jgi:hypothetical protein
VEPKAEAERSLITDHSAVSSSKQPLQISVHQSVQSDTPLERKTQHQKEPKNENSKQKQKPQSNVTIRGVRQMNNREGAGVTTSPTYSHSSSMSPPRVTYHMWRRPSALIASMRVLLRAILTRCSGMKSWVQVWGSMIIM